jgi:four helix bundle protein
MDPVTSQFAPRLAPPAERRVRAFKATDAFVIEAYRITTVLDGPSGRDLAREIRRIVTRCGGALVAASAPGTRPDDELRGLEAAGRSLAEGRYYLYLARRLGLIDVTRYRALMSRHDAATRELEHAIGESRPLPRARDPA